MQIENIELRKFADNEVLKKAIKDFFKLKIEERFINIKIDGRYSNKKDDELGQLTRAILTTEQIIDDVFKEIDKYKTIESEETKNTNIAR